MVSSPARILLIGPYDPDCGEFTFLAPPLGVWRLAGVLRREGVIAEVFDPNDEEHPREALVKVLRASSWDVVGLSTTGMTLQWDLELAHEVRRSSPAALLVAGGMEATFRPELMFELAPFDLVVLGEGERPMLEVARRLSQGADLAGIAGTAWREGGQVRRIPQAALDHDALRDSIFATPYEEMPYGRYWERLEDAYRIGRLPVKAEREARLAEIRSVRLITLNYCPMGCSFCSSTNFLNEAQGGTARIARLDEEEILTMIHRIVAAHPTVQTIIFQDDIFAFPSDRRILPLCARLIEARASGEIPADLSFISTNRIDAVNGERLKAMREAGFRVVGFGIENFSASVLREFRKERIVPHIDPSLGAALELGLKPFLDMILTSPRCGLGDLAETIRRAYWWIEQGCEVGMYPYVIPFSGAEMAADPQLIPHTVSERRQIAGTAISWQQPVKILPIDPVVRNAILEIERCFELLMTGLKRRQDHLPSRVRSYVWIASAIPILESLGEAMPRLNGVVERLEAQLPAGAFQSALHPFEGPLADALAAAGGH